MKTIWTLVAGVVFGLVAALVLRRNPMKQVKKEFEAIEAARVIKQDVLDKGATIARKRIEEDHKETIRKFDDEQKSRLEELRRDPVALARWLTRVSS